MMNLEEALKASGLFQEKCHNPDRCEEQGKVIVAIDNAAEKEGEIMVSVFCALHVPGNEIAKVFG